jgi:hypothetical protein
MNAILVYRNMAQKERSPDEQSVKRSIHQTLVDKIRIEPLYRTIEEFQHEVARRGAKTVGELGGLDVDHQQDFTTESFIDTIRKNQYQILMTQSSVGLGWTGVLAVRKNPKIGPGMSIKVFHKLHGISQPDSMLLEIEGKWIIDPDRESIRKHLR